VISPIMLSQRSASLAVALRWARTSKLSRPLTLRCSQFQFGHIKSIKKADPYSKDRLYAIGSGGSLRPLTRSPEPFAVLEVPLLAA